MKTILGRLVVSQKIAEDELTETQCGFRKGRGCTDMIFVLRQLVEKFWEQNSKALFTFIDLKELMTLLLERQCG